MPVILRPPWVAKGMQKPLPNTYLIELTPSNDNEEAQTSSF
jgi:hypothetical protein